MSDPNTMAPTTLVERQVAFVVGDPVGDSAPQVATMLEDVPEWLVNALAYLMDVYLGCHFTALLTALIRLEVAYGWDTNPTRGLLSTHRPCAVAEWIQGGRGKKTKRIVDIRDVEAYGKAWWAWWGLLQPEWRRRDAQGMLQIEEEHGMGWGSLDYEGQNGNLSVVAALYFWGSKKQMDVPEKMAEWQAQWELAVQDVCWMLEGLERIVSA
jgi:hypothetical protein